MRAVDGFDLFRLAIAFQAFVLVQRHRAASWKGANRRVYHARILEFGRVLDSAGGKARFERTGQVSDRERRGFVSRGDADRESGGYYAPGAARFARGGSDCGRGYEA